MNPRATWLWVAIATGLFAFIFMVERRIRPVDNQPAKILPGLKATSITSVQVLPAGQSEIRAERTNGSWQLTAPINYPAQDTSIDLLLAALEQIIPATRITPEDMKRAGQSDAKYGFGPPRATVILQQGDQTWSVHVGNKTAPGDQVFVQVAGMLDVYVVDAELLKLIPRTTDDWRDTMLVDFMKFVSDRLVVTNAGSVLDLRQTNEHWQMLQPMKTRADTARVGQSLRLLQALRVEQFVPSDAKIDLEAAGLQPAELSMAFKFGTNTTLLLEFGKSPANNPNQIYARRGGQGTVVMVSKSVIKPWLAAETRIFRDFLDPHLVSLNAVPDVIRIHARDDYALQRQTNDTWSVTPPGLAADAGLTQELLVDLASMIVSVEKDIVIQQNLQDYGLDSPVQSYVLESMVTNAAGITNFPIVKLDFGTNDEGKVFARNPDESFVYAIKPADFKRLESLASYGWKFRDRRIWNFSEDQVARITIQQYGKSRVMIRNGTNEWTLAPGSQGIINPSSLEVAAQVLGGMGAAVWNERGADKREAYGFVADGHKVTVELKSGEKFDVEFGGAAPSESHYAMVTIEGQPWIFECPLGIYKYVVYALSLPYNPP